MLFLLIFGASAQGVLSQVLEWEWIRIPDNDPFRLASPYDRVVHQSYGGYLVSASAQLEEGRSSLPFAPANRKLVMHWDTNRCAHAESYRLIVTDMNTGLVVRSIPTSVLTPSACFSSDGKLLYVSEGQHTLGVWDIDRNLRLSQHAIQWVGSNSLMLSPDQSLLAVFTGTKLEMYSLPAFTPRYTLNSITSFVFLAEGKTILTSTYTPTGSTLTHRHAASGLGLSTWAKVQNLRGLTTSQDGDFVGVETDYHLIVRSARDGRFVRQYPKGVLLSGNRFAEQASLSVGRYRMFEHTQSDPVFERDVPKSTGDSFLSPDGKTVFVPYLGASLDRETEAWNAADGSLKFVLDRPKYWKCRVAFSRLFPIYVITNGREARLSWLENGGTLVFNVLGHGQPSDVVLSKDESLMLVAARSRVHIVDLWSLTKIGELQSEEFEEIATVDTDDSSQFCFGAGKNGNIYVWDLASTQIVRKWMAHPKFGQYKSTCRHVQINPLDGTLMSCGNDGLVKFWNWQSGTEVRSLRVIPPESTGQPLVHTFGLSEDWSQLWTLDRRGLHQWETRTWTAGPSYYVQSSLSSETEDGVRLFFGDGRMTAGSNPMGVIKRPMATRFDSARLEVAKGQLVKGGLEDVAVNDNSIVEVRPGEPGQEVREGEILLEALAPRGEHERLGIRSNAFTDLPQVIEHLELFDWIAGKWVEVRHERLLSDKAVINESLVVNSGHRFVRITDQLVRGRLRFWLRNEHWSEGASVKIDQLAFVTSPR
ncbi:MAG: hypothetical protein KF884_03260 [Fimbriimonadaceae bacterium]|nr:hypothetical protein [Fimbriimonadaceae bacterium]QYK59113.1 MAG: hypothetical protein KF884_03260 [Fimbriimonadaceae bacterium]